MIDDSDGSVFSDSDNSNNLRARDLDQKAIDREFQLQYEEDSNRRKIFKKERREVKERQRGVMDGEDYGDLYSSKR